MTKAMMPYLDDIKILKIILYATFYEFDVYVIQSR